MASTLASFGGPSPHTSGLFADMTVDGPEIGTLVLIVDRAKNLPNRKTMGKQNPYCAARLGKEAKKTETDKRGGQTPRWDQELRFTVHDSPDYHTLKISIFSEDKRTDLIGEAWISLKEILNPGGGKADLWQGLNYKGKYAGELRIELTYYDTRPKPESAAESVAGEEDLRQSVGNGSARVKRRPLPSNPNSGHVTPDTIPQPGLPGRAKHGPREIRAPPRANSMPPEQTGYSQPQTIYAAPTAIHAQSYGIAPGAPFHQSPPEQHYADYNGYQQAESYSTSPEHMQPDFLPQLPPSNRQRGSVPPQPRLSNGYTQQQPPPLPLPNHIGLPHSHSSPAVPMSSQTEFEDSHQLRVDYPEPIPDLDFQHQQVRMRQRRSDVAAGWEPGYEDPHAGRPMQMHETHDAPPPPPVHSNSAPVIPLYSHSPNNSLVLSTPPSAHSNNPYGRHNSVPSSSPLQSIERTYGTPPQRAPMHGYAPSPEQSPYDMSPANHIPGQTPSPYARHPPALRPSPNRHSVADPYNASPTRPHPLSQEVPRPRSPQPYYAQELAGSSPHPQGHSPYEHDYRGRDAVPMIKPRAISPQPARPPPQQSSSAPRPKSSYSIQYPIRAFESSDNSPLNTSRPNPGVNTQVPRATPNRKSVSPQVATPSSPGGGMPFSPDSFDIHNPNARQSTLPVGNSPHTPYQVKPGSVPRDGNPGPIVGWHGQEIDPSDHLPVDSWAPEPEKKTPTKTYGLGRDRDFGPRSAQGSEIRHLSKDTVVNMRPRAQSQPPQEEQPSFRNKLQKKPAAGRSPIEPLKERHNYNSVSVPDPYAQNEYSPAFYQSNEGGYGGYGPPSASPADTLAREISSIDIGSGRYSRGSGVPPPTSYVPVRSHKDRRTFY